MMYKCVIGKILYNKDFVEYLFFMWIDYKCKIWESGRIIDFMLLIIYVEFYV